MFIENDTLPWVFLAYLMFGISTWVWIQLLRLGDLALMNTLWVVCALVGTVLIGVFIFRETLSTMQVLGIGACLLGILLIQWPAK